jgi:hypothetical protein
LEGVRVLNAKSVKILDSEIYGFTQNAIDVAPAANVTVKVGVYNNHIHDNTGNGVMLASSGVNGVAKAQVNRNVIEDNACGVVATSFGGNNAFTTNCGTNAAGAFTARGTAQVLHNLISDSPGSGVLARGSRGTVRIGDNDIVNNGTGMLQLDAGSLIESWGDNYLAGNGTNGTSNNPLPKG